MHSEKVHARFGRGHPETCRREPVRRRMPTLRHEPLVAALRATQTRESMTKQPAIQVFSERMFYEARIAVPVDAPGLARKVSRCSRTIPCRTVFSGSWRR